MGDDGFPLGRFLCEKTHVQWTWPKEEGRGGFGIQQIIPLMSHIDFVFSG